MAGRPRDPATRRAILDAAAALLAQGDYASLTMEGVARQAGVAKTTVYRRWPNKGLLVVEALFGGIEAGPLPDSGDFADDLRSVLEGLAAVLSRPGAATAVAGLLGDFGGDPVLRDALRTRFVFTARDRLTAVFDRAEAREQIVMRVGAHSVLASLTGALFFRSVVSGLPLDDDWLDQLVRLTLHGLARSET